MRARFTCCVSTIRQSPSLYTPPQVAKDEVNTDPYSAIDPANLNFAWNGEGVATLLPEQAFDDGEATFLTWPRGRDVPAILVTNAAGDEGPVNYTVRGDTIVIDGVPTTIVLRSGDESATLVNAGPPRRVANPDLAQRRD